MQRYDLDDLDRTIIGLLTEDGRLSASEIASKIGTASERTVRNRITALLQSRMITIGAIPDPTAMGRDVQADVMIEVEPGRIEEVVVRNTANATALYMESFVAPLTQDLGHADNLSDESRARIGALLENTALGRRVVSFKIWRQGGFLADASNTALVGRTFPPTENLKLAWAGEVRADFEDTGDPEDKDENALGVPLLEIYSPIRDVETGRVIAVAEFYEVATQLKADLIWARLIAWAAVAGVMALIGVVPGMPNAMFLLGAAFCGVIAWFGRTDLSPEAQAVDGEVQGPDALPGPGGE